ncbi:MAG TPA: phasin family protein, partial [Burkholderiales bacterium]|nr:phasin family protein [Burkholderiales bacterium]
MFINLDQITATGKNSVDVFSSLARTQLAFLEQLTALNVLTAKSSLEASAETSKAFFNVRRLQDVLDIGS